VKKVEPWNSVKVTLNLPRDAAQRLKALANQNDGAALRSVGIMSLQVEGKQLKMALSISWSTDSLQTLLEESLCLQVIE